MSLEFGTETSTQKTFLWKHFLARNPTFCITVAQTECQANVLIHRATICNRESFDKVDDTKIIDIKVIMFMLPLGQRRAELCPWGQIRTTQKVHDGIHHRQHSPVSCITFVESLAAHRGKLL